MKKFFIYITMALVILLAGCSTTESNEGVEVDGQTDSQTFQVAVSIVPQATIVEAIAGDFVDVVTMIPPGNSPANYAPTQKEMAQLSESEIYFAIGVPTEVANILPLLESEGYDVEVLHLDERVDAVYPARHFGEMEDDHDHEAEESHEDDHDHDEVVHEEAHDHEEASRDPHIWLSAKRIQLMAEEMAAALIKLDPEHEAEYAHNLEAFLVTLKTTNDELETMLAHMAGETFLIYHPSLGYFADEYGLKMLALENDGKSATVQGMATVIDFARDHHIKTVFYQAEFDAKQAQLLAEEIGGEAVQLNPLSKELVSNLKEMGTLINNSVE